MFCHHVGRILDRVAGLLIRARPLQNMRGKNISDVVRTMREQTLDRAPAGVGIEYAISLYGQSPCFVKCRRIVSGISAARFHRLYEEGLRIACISKKHFAVTLDVSPDNRIEAP